MLLYSLIPRPDWGDWGRGYWYLNVKDIVVRHEDDVSLGLELPSQVVGTHSMPGTSQHQVFNIQHFAA